MFKDSKKEIRVNSREQRAKSEEQGG